MGCVTAADWIALVQGAFLAVGAIFAVRAYSLARVANEREPRRRLLADAIEELKALALGAQVQVPGAADRIEDAAAELNYARRGLLGQRRLCPTRKRRAPADKTADHALGHDASSMDSPATSQAAGGLNRPPGASRRLEKRRGQAPPPSRRQAGSPQGLDPVPSARKSSD